jgi:hypothetical protein
LSKDLKQIREQTVDEENEQVVPNRSVQQQQNIWHNWNPVSEEKCPRDYLGMGDQIVTDPADF